MKIQFCNNVGGPSFRRRPWPLGQRRCRASLTPATLPEVPQPCSKAFGGDFKLPCQLHTYPGHCASEYVTKKTKEPKMTERQKEGKKRQKTKTKKRVCYIHYPIIHSTILHIHSGCKGWCDIYLCTIPSSLQLSSWRPVQLLVHICIYMDFSMLGCEIWCFSLRHCSLRGSRLRRWIIN